MTETITIRDLQCICVRNSTSTRIVYMIYPHVDGFDGKWLAQQSEKNHFSIVMVYVPLDKWNDYLTPWPEPGETPKAQPFAGEGADFLKILQTEIIPQSEQALRIDRVTSRDLVGVSLSGLFTLWQWMLCDTFRSIVTISGSFWYKGFMDWFEKQTIPSREGQAFFMLGSEEPKAHIKAYRTVGINTEKIVYKLRLAGIFTTYGRVLGNHFDNPLQRAETALDYLK